jgi:hypothetical protein
LPPFLYHTYFAEYQQRMHSVCIYIYTNKRANLNYSMSTKLLCTQNSQQRQMIPLNETYGRDSFVLRSRLFPPKFNPIRSPLMLIIGPLISLPSIALCSCPSSHSIFVPTKAGIGISDSQILPHASRRRCGSSSQPSWNAGRCAVVTF